MSTKTPSISDFQLPSFDEIRAIEREAHALRAAEMAHLGKAALAWLRNALHIGHHGTPVTR